MIAEAENRCTVDNQPNLELLVTEFCLDLKAKLLERCVPSRNTFFCAMICIALR